MSDDDARRQTATRSRDARLLEASLGSLPAPVERPALIVLIGLPGSGKSYFARAVSKLYPAAVLNSDALRGVLYKDPQHTEREHGRLFPAIQMLVERLLTRGVPVILDATNLKEAHRRPYYLLAERTGARVVLVRVWAPRKVIRERLRQRDSRRDPLDRSTADLEVYEKMRGDAERISRRCLSVNTGADIAPALDKLMRMLTS